MLSHAVTLSTLDRKLCAYIWNESAPDDEMLSAMHGLSLSRSDLRPMFQEQCVSENLSTLICVVEMFARQLNFIEGRGRNERFVGYPSIVKTIQNNP